MTSSIVCKDCGITIDPATNPTLCPACGSENRLITTTDESGLEVREDTVLTKKRPGRKSYYEKRKAGDSQSTQTGQWNRREQIVDRDNNRYRKRVVTPDGTVLRDVDEPLSDHQGYGDAKRSTTESKHEEPEG